MTELPPCLPVYLYMETNALPHSDCCMIAHLPVSLLSLDDILLNNAVLFDCGKGKEGGVRNDKCGKCAGFDDFTEAFTVSSDL